MNLKRNVTVVNPTDCEAKYSPVNLFFNTSQQICTDPNVAPCHGDSSLLAISESEQPYWYIVGISSFGHIHCGRLDWPNVSTKVSAYIDWIMENIRA